jgi:hypothetical protein
MVFINTLYLHHNNKQTTKDMKNATKNTATMTTLEKIQAVLSPMQIRKMKADLELAKEEYTSNYQSSKFRLLTELVSQNTRKNLEAIQFETRRLFGSSEMVLTNTAIKALCC